MGDRAKNHDALRVRTLGALRVFVGGEELVFAPLKHRELLAVLAVRVGTVVSTEQLIDEMWEGGAPDGARTTLQSYVSVIRKHLRNAGLGDRVVLETQEPGYVLRLADAEIDHPRFRRRIAAAQQALVAGDADEAHGLLSEALAEIDGPVCAELGHIDSVRSFVAEIAERRSWAIEQRVRLDIAGGRSSDVIGEIRDLTTQLPLDERFWELLMRALCGAGRHAEALRAYQEARTTFAEAAGIDPSPQLQALERAILDGRDADAGGPAVSHSSTRGVRSTHPPVHATRLIGRETDMAAIMGRIASFRLTTLVGPGGAGKTRLASEVASRLRPEFDRVCWADLEPARDQDALVESLFRAFGIAPNRVASVADAIADHIAGQRVLLVVDNCEHLIESSALVVSNLLRCAPDLRILTTSRQALAVASEVVERVGPLSTGLAALGLVEGVDARALAAPSDGPGGDDAAPHWPPSPAAQLLLERADSLDVDVGTDLATVEAVCAELDGLPLAIELAAPLLVTFRIEELAGGLRERVLAQGVRRGGNHHHRTMGAVVGWSYDLLDADERRLFDAVSVFRGSFSVDAARSVGAALGLETDPLLHSLIRQSMVQRDEMGDGNRYRLLGTLRSFGLERLRASSEHADVQHAFLHHFRTEAVRWERSAATAAASSWRETCGNDRDNYRKAVHLARRIDPPIALDLIHAFRWVFNFLGDLPATIAWLDQLVDGDPPDRSQIARARLGQACLANFGGAYGETAGYAEQAIDHARALAEEGLLYDALIIRGTTAVLEGNFARAAECFGESMPLSEERGDAGGVGISMVFSGTAYRRMGDYRRAKECFDRAYEAFDRLGDDRGLALTLGNIGRMAQQQGDLDRALLFCDEAVGVAMRSQDPMVMAQAFLFRGHVFYDMGDHARAIDDFGKAFTNASGLGNRTLTSASLEWLVLAGGGDAHTVVTIDAFTKRHRDAPETASARVEWEAAVAGAEVILGSGAVAATRAVGDRMSLDDAAMLAIDAATSAIDTAPEFS